MTMTRGRGSSAVRTPSLIRDYLRGEVAFPQDEPGDALARTLEGDYISRMHQRVKLRIREINPGYQYPRKHSFLSLVNALLRLGLVERTGRREDPEERGAGQVGVAGGFEQRTWVRLTAGSAQRTEWADPIGHMALIYPNVRPARGALPTSVTLPTPGRRPRRERPGAPAAELVDQLNARRLDLIDDAVAAQSKEDPQTFQALAADLRDFLRDVARVFPTPQFIDAAEALALLRNCVALLENAIANGRGVAIAVTNCQASARLAGEGLSTPLVGGAELGPARGALRQVPAIPSIELPENFTVRSAPRLTEHLATLVDIARDFDWPDVRFTALAAEVQRLLERGQDWLEAAQDSLESEEGKDSPREATLEARETRVESLQQYVDALDNQDLEGALESLNELA
jgi:hypothetical protein